MGIFAEIGNVMMEESITPSESRKTSAESIPTSSTPKRETPTPEWEVPPFEGEVVEIGEDMIPVVVNYIYTTPLRTPPPEESSETKSKFECSPDVKELEEILDESPAESNIAANASIISENITFEGDTEIRGDIKGNITAKHSLLVYGTITGNVSASVLTLYGTILGSVSCKSLTLCSTKERASQVKGSIKTDALFTEFT